MPNYRRNYVPGGTYFFTVVAHQRRPVLTTELGRGCLRRAFGEVRQGHPFELNAVVLLPDHLHCIWTLPSGDADFSSRWSRIKEAFTRGFLRAGGTEGVRTTSRRLHRERAVWQRRFWEHTCTDEEDYKRFLDYLHWNPVKHGLVSRVREYPWSSFFRYVGRGEYPLHWGEQDPCPGYDVPEWE